MRTLLQTLLLRTLLPALLLPSLILAPAAPAAAGETCRIHYHRPDGEYAGWGLHVWEHTTESVTWTAPLAATGRDDYGIYWDVGLADGGERIGFIVHRGEEKDPGPDQFLEVERHGLEVWTVSGSAELHSAPPDVSRLGLGDLTRSRAFWVDARTVAWDVFVPSGGTVRLHASADGSLKLERDGVSGGRSFPLQPARGGLTEEARAKFPHLASLRTFRLPDDAVAAAPELLRGQLAVSLADSDGQLQDATGLQIPGVLDDLFAWDGPLGVTWDDGVPSLRVWAPTARAVRLLLFPEPDGAPRTLPMTADHGVWTARGRADWKNAAYLYEVELWVPSTGRVETNRVTDPYSRGLTRNSLRSVIVDPDDPATQPEGWDSLAKPALDAPEDIVLYELHVRDFSAADPEVPADLRGTFRAFGVESHGTRHLRALAEAGLTHVHLLPAFDIATVNEDRGTWMAPPEAEMASLPADSPRQQMHIDKIRGMDGFNWGYDPFH
ncbi:MAG: DUF3372 domain-containing protein, partial [Gemmatimonadetes bacterium]|nr:DUF3372 domain-containing protein [Gemmatimonadota bacterium]